MRSTLSRATRLCAIIAGSAIYAFAATNSAAFLRFDTTTQGTWKGVYGSDGYVIVNDSNSPPKYGSLNVSGATAYTWVASSTDPRALQKGASASDRIESTYYSSSSFTFDVNLSDGQLHQVAFYCLDPDIGNRSQTISALDGNSNAVLGTQSVSNFGGGVYAVWIIQGHVLIRVNNTGPSNAVTSGVFFGGGSGKTPPTVSLASPSAGTVSGSVMLSATANSPAGIASVQFLLDGSNLGAPVAGSGPTYSTSWVSNNAINGSHVLTAVATDKQGQSAVSPGVAVAVTGGMAPGGTAFVKFDAVTQGTWNGTYGSDGYIIANGANSPPGYASVAVSGANTWTWFASTTDPRALLKGPATTDRIASAYYSSSTATFDVNLTDGQAHEIALYCLDLDSTSRAETISLVDASSHAVLDTENLSGFHNGIYAVWNVQGHVLIQVTDTGGLNAVVSGLFFGGGGTTGVSAPTVSITNPAASSTVSGSITLTANVSSNAAISSVQFQLDTANIGAGVAGTGSSYNLQWASTSTVNGSHTLTATATDSLGHTSTSSGVTFTVANTAVSESATFLKFDTTTQGNWSGAYGQDGYVIANGSNASPTYAAVNVTGAASYTWLPSTTDPRALLKSAAATDRIASTWFSNSGFSFDVNLKDGQTHRIALYCLDFDSKSRSEVVSIVDANSGAVLDTENLSNFIGGVYAVWNIQGHVLIQVTYKGGSNAVASGLFFGGTGTGPSVSISSPSSNSHVSGTVTISASASASAGVSSVQFQLDGANLGSAVTGAGPSFTAQWVTTATVNGSHVITAIAADSLGQHTTSAGVPVIVANGTSANSAQFVGFDTGTQGNWKGTYGQDGYLIANDSNQQPSYASVTVTGASTYTWLSSTTDPRALLKPASTTDRIAATYYSAYNAGASFTFDVNVMDGQSHQVAVYCLDEDAKGRVETISVLDATSHAVLDTENVSNFVNGAYAVWTIQGHVQIQVSKAAGDNAVVSGVFFQAPGSVAPPNLQLSKTVLTFAGTSGQTSPAAQTISISNGGGGTLNWTASKTQPWLTLPVTSGTGSANLSVSANTAGLAPGTYSDAVIVAAAGAANSPQQVKVTLQLAAAPSGPLMSWTFEPATISGATVLDSSGNNLNGTIYGGVTPVPGKIGQALSFDGSTGWITTAPDPRPALGAELTLAAWIRTTNASRIETIISKYDLTGSEDGYIFETTAAGFLALHLGGNEIQGTNRDVVDGTNPINDGQWHHVAVIIRSGEDVSFYVDGGLSSVYYLTTSEGAYGPPVNVGGPVSARSNYFTGSMDQLVIYARALGTTEVAQLFGGPVTTVPGGQILYNGIAMPKNFPPPTLPTQMLRTPYYINNPPLVIPIDVGRQLFVDDFLIQQTTLQRTQHQPSIYPNPVLTPGSPISGGAWYDPATQLYKMWYYNTTNDYRYAYSSDGKKWTLPSIPDALVPNTNEVVTGGDTVWLDQQETNPARRYKAFGVNAGAGKVYVYFSADGIHWGTAQDFNMITLSDRTTAFRNPFRNVWVNSDRSAAAFPATAYQAAQSTRARYYSESPDLTTWTPQNPGNTFWTGADDHDPPYYLNNPGGQPPELYDLDCVAYESVMVGLFSWFYPGIGYQNYTLPGPILVELGVGFSRDGFSWVRPTRSSGPSGAFIPASNTAGTWNAYNTQSVGGGFLVVGDELLFYFSGRTLQKPNDGTFSTGLATLRRDGFYSMDAGTTPGTLVTRPVHFSGSHLFVNVNDPGGQLLVEVLDANGNVIEPFSSLNCVPVTVDKTLQEVTWNGASLASLAGQNVQFKFYLTNGSLYSFWVTSSAQGASNGYVAAGGPGFTGVTDTVGAAGYPPK